MSVLASTPIALSPTLWRTCRVLANGLRLRILQELIREPDQTVASVAANLKIPPPLTSRYLRALNARGLLEARRSHKWVRYRPSPNKSVSASFPLLKAIKQTFASEKQPIETIYRQVTAFTHPRRVQIVHALRGGQLTKASLRISTGISQPALRRHLKKLLDRGFVEVGQRTCRCAKCTTPLPKTLLKFACTP